MEIKCSVTIDGVATIVELTQKDLDQAKALLIKALKDNQEGRVIAVPNEPKIQIPSDATHYHPTNSLYCKFGKAHQLFVWIGGVWIRVKSKVKKSFAPELQLL